MSLKLKTTELKKGVKKGDYIPFKQEHCWDPGAVGKWLEDELVKNGYYIQRSDKSVDMPHIGVEVKSRKEGSTSAHTVGSMTVEEIIRTPYDSSIIKKKVQQQYRAHYDDKRSVITEARIYDFDEEFLQSNIREAYEIGRRKLKNGERGNYIKTGSKYGIFERHSSNSYIFRIPNSGMENMEEAVKNKKNIDKFFG